jgi:hypothetical protein
MEPRASHVPGKCSTTEHYPQLLIILCHLNTKSYFLPPFLLLHFSLFLAGES